MTITRIHSTDDLVSLCNELSPEKWGKDNDMPSYTPESLKKFLANRNNLLTIGSADGNVVSVALCYVLDHPDQSRKSLYVDELETHPNHRRKGYASAMITWLKAYVAEHDLNEVWLGTELEDNEAANLFYESMHPTETVKCNLYSYATKQIDS